MATFAKKNQLRRINLADAQELYSEAIKEGLKSDQLIAAKNMFLVK